MQLANWLQTRYDILWNTFKDHRFDFEEAVRVLADMTQGGPTPIKPEDVLVVLSELRRADWLSAEADAKDARKKHYKLRSKEEILKGMLSADASKLTRTDLEVLLKKAADLIRTRVDYKFILILLFLKRISDKWETEFQQAYEEAVADGYSEDDARVEAKRDEYHLFNLPEEFQWESLRKDVSGLTERFSRGLKVIGERNPELKDVVDSIDFLQFTSSKENAEILRQLVELFSEKKLRQVSPDILGDAYEWILKYFAPTKAKEGEIYTPREVIRLLVQILDPKPMESVYDPACGSGGMLISAYRYVEEKYGKEEVKKLFLFGQEVNQRTIALAKMNMYIHDIPDCHLEFGDTFLYPKFKEGDVLKTFDLVLANPPWNQDGYGEEVLRKGEFWKKRFPYVSVPNQSADWAWIQHMVASADDNNGRVGIIIDSGCLFRGGKEGTIRTEILKRGWIDSIILLPEKLFYNTPAPGVAIILRKNKQPGAKESVFFINASKEFEQHPELRKLNRLAETNIEKIVDQQKTLREEKGFSRIVSLDEIKRNKCSLNVTLYVTSDERHEEIDITKEFSELERLEKERQTVGNRLKQYISEITKATGGHS